MSTPSQPLNLWAVIAQSNRIINAYSRHFCGLCAIFLLPLSFSLILCLSFQSNLSQPDSVHTQILLFHTSHQPWKSAALPLLYAFFFFSLSLCAVGSITFSTYHRFSGGPPELLPAIKSILHSFIPILSTTIASQIVAVFIIVVFVFFVGLVSKGAEILGFEIDYKSNYFIVFCLAVSIFLGLVLVANWSLACVIVVAESKWGFEPLRRSFYLARGMRPLSMSLLFFWGVLVRCFVWGASMSLLNTGGVSGWKTWAFIFQKVVNSIFASLFILTYLVGNTVLYMYSKASRGELAFEIAEEFAHDYDSLPLYGDGEMMSHLSYAVLALQLIGIFLTGVSYLHFYAYTSGIESAHQIVQ